MKRRVLIIFPYPNLAFSPMTLNLYDALAPVFEVMMLTLEPHYYSSKRAEGKNVCYVRLNRLLLLIAAKIDRVLGKLGRVPRAWRWLVVLSLVRRAPREPFDIIIGTDFTGLWVAQRLFGHGHLLSLEIAERDSFKRLVDKSRIDSVLVQSEERRHHLFGNNGPRAFIVQNAPVYRTFEPPSTRSGFVFCGTALPQFGIFRCLDYVNANPDATLTVQGAVPDDIRKRIEQDYGALLETDRVRLVDTYVSQDQLSKYLSQFRFGFCCYDLSYREMNTFNYLTAPSGKVTAYFAAGIPVIGTKVPGLRAVKDFNAGVLIDEFTSENIQSAVEIIEAAYDEMTANCLRAAQEFSFDRKVQPFVRLLQRLNQNSTSCR